MTPIATLPLGVSEIADREEWNRRVVGLPNPDLRQGYEWGEMRKADGWKPRRLAVLEGDVCQAAVSILVKGLPFGRRTILYAPGGPLIRDCGNEEVMSSLMAAIEAIAREERAIFLRADPRLPDDVGWIRTSLCRHGFHHLPDDWTTWNTPRIVMMMELDEPEAAIKKKLRRRFRDYISSAPARGLSVRSAAPQERGREFHSALAAAGRRKGLPVRGRRHFESLWQEYLRDDRGVLLIAQHSGSVVGGLLGTRMGKTAYMLYVTQRDRPEGDPLHQGPVLYWEFVRWAKSRGCDRIDWGGVGTHYPPREDDPGFGVYVFKRGFNSSLCYMTGYYDRVFSQKLYRGFRSLERSASAVAWTARAKLNDAVLLFDDIVDSGERKIRQFRVSIAHRGIGTTLYWAAFGFLKPNRFMVLARDLAKPASSIPPAGDLILEIWPSWRMKEWRLERPGLSTEFFQNEIDGVENCVVARDGEEIAGLMWIYYPGDRSRLFQLREGEAELNQAYVLPQYRGRGILKRLLNSACDTLAAQGYRTAYAMVHVGNVPSLKAVRDVGFHSLGRVRHFLAWRPRFRTARHADASSVS